jgi:hypothetical protein
LSVHERLFLRSPFTEARFLARTRDRSDMADVGALLDWVAKMLPRTCTDAHQPFGRTGVDPRRIPHVLERRSLFAFLLTVPDLALALERESLRCLWPVAGIEAVRPCGQRVAHNRHRGGNGGCRPQSRRLAPWLGWARTTHSGHSATASRADTRPLDPPAARTRRASCRRPV